MSWEQMTEIARGNVGPRACRPGRNIAGTIVRQPLRSKPRGAGSVTDGYRGTDDDNPRRETMDVQEIINAPRGTPAGKVRRFVTITSDSHIEPDKSWMQNMHVRKVHNYAGLLVLIGIETYVTIAHGGMQNGSYTWHVTVAQPDSPIEFRSGQFGKVENSYGTTVEYEVNKALTELTQRWLTKYLPTALL